MFTFLIIAVYLARLGASADAVVTIDLAFLVESTAGALHTTSDVLPAAYAWHCYVVITCFLRIVCRIRRHPRNGVEVLDILP